MCFIDDKMPCEVAADQQRKKEARENRKMAAKRFLLSRKSVLFTLIFLGLLALVAPKCFSFSDSGEITEGTTVYKPELADQEVIVRYATLCFTNEKLTLKYKTVEKAYTKKEVSLKVFADKNLLEGQKAKVEICKTNGLIVRIVSVGKYQFSITTPVGK